jgi:cell division protein FtsL
MIRVNLVLLFATLMSALFLVSVQYDSRRLFAELDKSRNESKRLASEFDRLQVEKRGQATPSRVERIAREKLQMYQATPGITTYVTYSSSADMAHPAAPGAEATKAARATP